MSILGSYLRLSAADLARAVEQPGWVEEFRDEQAELRTPSEQRLHETGPAWGEPAVLLGRCDLPADLVHGDRPLPGADDRGYGPPRLRTPEQVAAVERRLADLPVRRPGRRPRPGRTRGRRPARARPPRRRVRRPAHVPRPDRPPPPRPSGPVRVTLRPATGQATAGRPCGRVRTDGARSGSSVRAAWARAVAAATVCGP
ncbi:DUF1877 family protein [Kitasatospora griseola]|uniref:DUF1877 family protein n=1 Tax=Kitasatospora griseola TaxID=2064 RepID=UPI00342297C9